MCRLNLVQLSGNGLSPRGSEPKRGREIKGDLIQQQSEPEEAGRGRKIQPPQQMWVIEEEELLRAHLLGFLLPHEVLFPGERSFQGNPAPALLSRQRSSKVDRDIRQSQNIATSSVIASCLSSSLLCSWAPVLDLGIQPVPLRLLELPFIGKLTWH